LFLSNKYTDCYFRIINKANLRKPTQVTECHHIIPKSLGGGEEPENKVYLTPREHFVCHHLLIKMLDGKSKQKMCYAFYRMSISNGNGVRCENLNSYNRIRKKYSYLTSGENNPFYGKGHFGFSNPMLKPEVREKHKQIVSSPEHRKMMSDKMSGENNPFYGKCHSDKTKKYLSELASQRTGKNSPRYGKKHRQVVCEHCQKQITYPMYKRWHGTNCKIYKENKN
jgi:hypothetical protein